MSGGVDSAVAAARCVAAGSRRDRHLAAAGARRHAAAAARSTISSTRARGRRPARHSRTTCSTSGDAFERAVVAALRRRVPRRAHAEPVRALQPAREVRRRSGDRARELGRRAASRPATTRASAPTRRPAAALPADRGRCGKDQTYFLFALGSDALGRTRSSRSASSPRARCARRPRALGLAVADKPESMEVCFVPRRRRGGFVERHAPAGALRPGRVVDEDGPRARRHDGVHRFTVGQRRGLGLGGGARRYVRALDGHRHRHRRWPGGLRARGLIAP